MKCPKKGKFIETESRLADGGLGRMVRLKDNS